MRVLVTGAGGFAGHHLVELCAERASVTGLGRRPDPPPDLADAMDDYVAADLTDAESAAAAVAAAEPDMVFHLAAQASVGESWKQPVATVRDNLSATQAVLEAVRAWSPETSVLVACSGEEYGPPETLPVAESHTLRPQNPYAVSKAAADVLAGFYADAYGLRVIRARAFNHAGPGQSTTYVVSSLARQIAAAEAEGKEEVTLRTGNLAPSRDFTDVRDVVAAYWLLAERGTPGAYNVCSGSAVAIADILAGLARHSALDVSQHTDPELLRDAEVMEIRGTHEKLTAATGWHPQIALERTLADTLDWWREQLAVESQA